MSKANEVQVAGDHYKRAGNHQHWDFAADNQLGYFEGQVTKYVTRWRKKAGLQDLKKAAHFLDKLYELMTTSAYTSPQLSVKRLPIYGFSAFAKANELGTSEGRICILMVTYRTSNDLLEVKRILAELIERAQAEQSNRTEERVTDFAKSLSAKA